MKSVVMTAPGSIVIKEADRPTPDPNEALLQVLYGGICGTDLSAYRGVMPYVTYPYVPGHEFSARIVAVGENPYGLKTGMIVTGNPYYNCGKCYSCERGLLNCCEQNRTCGVHRKGWFSEYVTLPFERIYPGDGISARLMALVEPFCISYHGVKRANVKKGERVLVVGAGTIGTLAAISAKLAGAEVTVCDVSANKLALARMHGVDQYLLSDTPERFTSLVREYTQAKGYDVTIEAVGLPSTFQSCIDSAAYGGRVVLIGVSKKNLDFKFSTVQKKELAIFGSRNAVKSDFAEVIEIVKSGRVDLESLVTNTYDFTQAADAFEHFDKNASDTLKVLLQFGEADA